MTDSVVKAAGQEYNGALLDLSPEAGPGSMPLDLESKRDLAIARVVALYPPTRRLLERPNLRIRFEVLNERLLAANLSDSEAEWQWLGEACYWNNPVPSTPCESERVDDAPLYLLTDPVGKFTGGGPPPPRELVAW